MACLKTDRQGAGACAEVGSMEHGRDAAVLSVDEVSTGTMGNIYIFPNGNICLTECGAGLTKT